MKLFLPACLAGLVLISAPALAQQAAQAPVARQIIPGLAVANVSEIINSSRAFINAAQERQTVYKSQIDMAEARRKQINAEIEPLVSRFNTSRDTGTAPQEELQRQLQMIQSLNQSGVQDLQTILAPVTLSENYVREQIGDMLNKAITSAMDRNGITFVVPPANVLAFNNAYNLGPAVLAELNAMLPVAKVVPPSGWMPRAEREAAAAQAAPPAQPARRGNARPRGQ